MSHSHFLVIETDICGCSIRRREIFKTLDCGKTVPWTCFTYPFFLSCFDLVEIILKFLFFWCFLNVAAGGLIPILCQPHIIPQHRFHFGFRHFQAYEQIFPSLSWNFNLQKYLRSIILHTILRWQFFTIFNVRRTEVLKPI